MPVAAVGRDLLMSAPIDDTEPSHSRDRDLDDTEPSDSRDRHWMLQALAEADAAAAHADVPIGCVIVAPEGHLLAAGHNRREIDEDPTAHAEVVAIREAARRRGHWRLDGCTLYVTLEPCPMCAGAIVNSRISRVVYGAADPKAGAVDTLYQLGNDRRLNHRFEHRGMVMADESVMRLRRFFAKLRAEGQK
ncbi:MAG: nucleoside deaminase [Myxococcales bacterium]|nr:nucleoside deaminase [Myxococcales bacterium]